MYPATERLALKPRGNDATASTRRSPNRVSLEAFEGLEPCEGKLSCTFLEGWTGVISSGHSIYSGLIGTVEPGILPASRQSTQNLARRSNPASGCFCVPIMGTELERLPLIRPLDAAAPVVEG
jgi:hypothetical protein